MGFLFGVSAVDAELGEHQRLEATEFDQWMRRLYGRPEAHWSRVLRALEGIGSAGLNAFASRWAEFSERRKGTSSE